MIAKTNKQTNEQKNIANVTVDLSTMVKGHLQELHMC